jgi:hypothetical protein
VCAEHPEEEEKMAGSLTAKSQLHRTQIGLPVIEAYSTSAEKDKT